MRLQRCDYPVLQLFLTSGFVNQFCSFYSFLLSPHLDLLFCMPLSSVRKLCQGPQLLCSCIVSLFALISSLILCPYFAESAFDLGLLHNLAEWQT